MFNFRLYYIKNEKLFLFFHVLLSLFVFSIILLIFSPGVFSIFLGWDGLGLSSFLLVIFYRNTKSLRAGLLTFLTNRTGDGLLICGRGARL